jgi:hypothetical protein
MAEHETSEREIAERELAEYERWAAAHPDAEGVDATDLAAIGAARYERGITKAQVARLVQVALEHGHTWDEIADRLGMTPEQAKRSYGTKPMPKTDLPQTIRWMVLNAVANVLGAISHALSEVESMAREHSRH